MFCSFKSVVTVLNRPLPDVRMSPLTVSLTHLSRRGLAAVSPETSVFSSARWTSVSGSQPRNVLPPPGDTVWYLGSSAVATTRCAPGIEWGALGVLLKFLQCTGQTPP